MKKPRSDSKLANLPEERQEEIFAWCKEGLEAARDLCLAKHNLSVSLRCLSSWHAWRRQQQELQIGNAGVVAILDWFKHNKPGASPAEIRTAMLMGLTLKAQARDDMGAALGVLKEQGKDLDRGLATRRVAVLEKKLERAGQIVKAAQEKGGMTPETLARLEKELKML